MRGVSLQHSRQFAVGLIALAILALSAPAWSDRESVSDTQGDNTDPEGHSTHLDIASLSFGHRQNPSTPAEPRELTLRVDMFEPWTNEVLVDRNETVTFHIRVNKARCINRVLDIRLTPDGNLYGDMIGGCGGPAKFFGYVRVWRPNDRSLKVAFPRSMLGPRAERFGVRVLTSNTRGECQRPSGESTEPCEDVAPEDSLLIHEL
jgi:hypothetical protein